MSATIFAGNLTLTYGVIAHLGLIWYLERWDEPRYDNTVAHLYYTHRGAHAYHLYLVGRLPVEFRHLLEGKNPFGEVY